MSTIKPILTEIGDGSGFSKRTGFRATNLALGHAFRLLEQETIAPQITRQALFFRYDSRSKVIVYAWVNDENTLRSSGSKSDHYTLFLKMLSRGNPPGTWDLLLRQSKKIKL